MSHQIHFVHETKPGAGLDSSQVRALRSHVRKVNLERSNQKSTRRLENFRSLTVTDFSEGGKTRSNKRKQSLQPVATPSLEGAIEDLPLGEDPAQGWPFASNAPQSPTETFRDLSSPSSECLDRPCSCYRESPSAERAQSPNHYLSPTGSSPSAGQHPYASRISEAIELDEARIDSLLQSCKTSRLSWIDLNSLLQVPLR